MRIILILTIILPVFFFNSSLVFSQAGNFVEAPAFQQPTHADTSKLYENSSLLVQNAFALALLGIVLLAAGIGVLSLKTFHEYSRRPDRDNLTHAG